MKLGMMHMENCNVDYHKNTDSDIFEEWFEFTLISNLKPNSIIVLDNASYHSKRSKKIPNAYSRKLEIQAFLMEHDLYFEERYQETTARNSTQERLKRSLL
jgi:predicted O-methyltransferase YrrM